MATTTNYAWETPDDTDLVKDGALAIRTLGSSIDTTTKALNPSTTLGDLEYRSSTANTNTRLGIGSSGQVLTVSGGVPTWAAAAGGGGFTLLSTTAASGNSVTVSSINQTYKHLFFEIFGITNTGGNHSLYIAPNSADNLNATCVFISSSTVTTNGDNATSNISRADLNASSSDNYFSGWIYDYTNATTSKQFTCNGTFRNAANNLASIQYNAGIRTTSAITEVRFMIGNSFSNPFSAGSIRMYGVK